MVNRFHVPVTNKGQGQSFYQSTAQKKCLLRISSFFVRCRLPRGLCRTEVDFVPREICFCVQKVKIGQVSLLKRKFKSRCNQLCFKKQKITFQNRNLDKSHLFINDKQVSKYRVKRVFVKRPPVFVVVFSVKVNPYLFMSKLIFPANQNTLLKNKFQGKTVQKMQHNNQFT